jgi:hypothetical protein
MAMGYGRVHAVAATAVGAMVLGFPVSAVAYDGSGSGNYAYDGGMDYLTGSGPTGPGPGQSLAAPSVSAPLSFSGISQYDTAGFGRNFIPPDTMGAVGATQFMETSNGAYAVYNKTTGALESMQSDVSFWNKAGQAGANGDSRVLFDAASHRWIVESFAASESTIQIAVSDTSNAIGPWHSTTFTGYAGGTYGGIADYPTLALDSKAIYIGTNDYKLVNANGDSDFAGTTLNVISRNSLFGTANAPNVNGLQQFFTPCAAPSYQCLPTDYGYAIQGVNQVNGGDSGKIVAVGANNYGLLTYTLSNPGSGAASRTNPVLLDTTPYDPNKYARQPAVGQPQPYRFIDPLDDRVSSGAWEYDGKIYTLHTITPTGTDHTAIQWYVIDAATQKIVQEGMIGGNGDGYDYYQGSIAINDEGEVVIGYNRSGSQPGSGKVTFLAQVFDQASGGNGAIAAVGSAIILKVSGIDDYHNGAVEGVLPPQDDRQRWGDYSQVTVDPNNPNSFWAIGEYAIDFNSPAYGHPNGTGGSRWGTWISEIDVASGAVPEPSTWVMLILGAGALGGVAARRRSVVAAASRA